MPRRNQRPDAEPPPLSITPQEVSRPRRPLLPGTPEERREELDEYHRKRRAAQRRRRVSAAINWRVCCVPGCDDESLTIGSRHEDVDIGLPICGYHAAIIKRQVDLVWDDEPILEERRRVQAHREQIADGAERARIIAKNTRHGQLYFVRANGLVKVGWTSDLAARLKSYGPDVELLCHYPGTRQDETLMHRQLKPYLAKGREWYEDCKLIADVVAATVKRHGPPTMSVAWTQPKPAQVKPRGWSGR